MAEYHNILTQVQVRGPAEMGLDERGIVAKERGVEPRFSSLLGVCWKCPAGSNSSGHVWNDSVVLGNGVVLSYRSRHAPIS